jgi:hypothetical protein
MNTPHAMKYKYRTFGSQTITTWDYEEHGILGVGKQGVPIINMDQYINHDQDQQLHIECCKGLAVSRGYKTGMFGGAIIPEERSRFGNKDGYSEMLYHLEKHDPLGDHKRALEEIADTVDPKFRSQAFYRYAYYALGAAIPWFFGLYLKENTFWNKTEDLGNWTEDAKHFPKLVQYIKTLPFKVVGRVLFFTSYPNAGVATHRDDIIAEHSDHNINIFFTPGWRPSFIWDEIRKEKVYLPSGASSYYFNNRDYHGVDPEPVFRYTLRIDGTFTDELCEQLDLEDGYTWRQSYMESR